MKVLLDVVFDVVLWLSKVSTKGNADKPPHWVVTLTVAAMLVSSPPQTARTPNE